MLHQTYLSLHQPLLPIHHRKYGEGKEKKDKLKCKYVCICKYANTTVRATAPIGAVIGVESCLLRHVLVVLCGRSMTSTIATTVQKAAMTIIFIRFKSVLHLCNEHTSSQKFS